MRVAEARARGLAARRALDRQHRHRASASICHRIERSRWFHHAVNIAVYLPLPDEVDLRPLIHTAAKSGKRLYAPVVESRRKMRFVSLDQNSPLVVNRFGIAEPSISRRNLASTIARSQLHLVCAPLSAFDRNCHRTGMGGGFYDRYFGRREGGHSQRLIGVAFEVQAVPPIDVRPWDIPMDAIVTDRGVYRRCGVSHIADDL